MRILLLGRRTLCAGICCVLQFATMANIAPANDSATPAALVKAALESELAGPSDARNQLLAEALKSDPNFGPARWQSGFVRFGDQWVKVDDVPKHTGDDKQLAAYRAKRDGLIDTADNHRALARWCKKNKLAEEERIHWAKVLEFDRGDAEAMGGLGLQLHDGRLLTRAQIDQEKVKAGERLRAMQVWQPRVVKWRAAIEQGSGKSHDEALAKLKEASDPAAIPALEAVLAINADSKKSTLLNKLLIEVVGRMREPEATALLLRRSLAADSIEVRAAAADELKKRPMHTYVPRLIAAMPNTLKSWFHVRVLPNGTVIHEHELLLEGQQADYSMVYESVFTTDPTGALFATPAHANLELRKAAIVEAAVQNTRARQDWVRDRVKFVLRHTTGFEDADDPQLWNQQYNDYHGWRTPDAVKPKYTQIASDYRTYVSAPAPDVTLTSSPRPAASTTPLTWHPDSANMRTRCFPAGTPVMTMDGARPVETIKVGDRVLSQNTETGELTYKIVQETTLRSPIPLIKIGLGSESLCTTAGHPFWVSGNGWQVARNLKVGAWLHGLDGTCLIDSIEELPPREVYNLIVSDFGNYFVGDHRLLVHDNSPLGDATSSLPGLAGSVAAP